MTWSKFDDVYDEHENVEEAWFAFPPNPIGLHVQATTACNRWLSDGLIRPRWLEKMLPDPKDYEAILEAMVRYRLFDRIEPGQVLELVDKDGVAIVFGPFDDVRYVVHDFLDHHDSRREIKERRAEDAHRKREERRGKSNRTSVRTSGGRPDGDRPESDRSPELRAPAGARAGARVPTRPDPTTTTGPNGPVEPERLDTAQHVQAVFDAWIDATGKTGRTVLDDKRRRLIRKALQAYPLDEVLAAVRGWQHSPHHRGENERQTVYNDLELLLRDPQHIERFRDFERQARAVGPRTAAGIDERRLYGPSEQELVERYGEPIA